MEGKIRTIDSNVKCWPRPFDRLRQLTILPVSLPCTLEAQEPPGPCFKCGKTGHWAWACPNPHIGPTRLCLKCHREGHWVINCPHARNGMETSDPDNSQTNLLSLAMDNWGCPGSLDPTTTVVCNREPWVNITVSGWAISLLLDTRAPYLVLREFGVPTSPSTFPIVVVGGQHYLTHQTPPHNCIFKGIPLTHSFLVMPTYPVPLMGRDYFNWSGSFYFVCSSHSPHPRLASSSSPSPPSLPTSQLQRISSSTILPGKPQVWDTQNPSVARHHSPIVIQLQDPTRYITQTHCLGYSKTFLIWVIWNYSSRAQELSEDFP